MNALLIIVIIIMFTIQLTVFMLFNNRFRKNNSCYYAFSLLYLVLTAIILMIVNGGLGDVNFITILFGFAFGIIFIFTMNFTVIAMSKGPIGYTVLIFQLNMLITMIVSLIFYGETINFLQIIGILLLFLTFYLGSTASTAQGKKMTLKWLMFALLAFLGGGSLGVLVKTHQYLFPGQYIVSYLVIGILSAAVVAGILIIIRRFKYGDSIHPIRHKNVIFLVLAASITSAVGNYMFLKMVSHVPAVVLFPIVNGSQIILMTIISIFIFKEKLTFRSTLGIVIGIIAVVLISL